MASARAAMLNPPDPDEGSPDAVARGHTTSVVPEPGAALRVLGVLTLLRRRRVGH